MESTGVVDVEFLQILLGAYSAPQTHSIILGLAILVKP